MSHSRRAASHRHESLMFPDEFLWGTATSAHQIEGNNKNNDWWQWELQGRVHSNQKSGMACDHYRRFEQDFDLAAKMNNNAHRLSIEWSRIQPEPDGWDYSKIEHYKKVLQSLKDRKMKTMVTLHHFTNPLWFTENGGWLRGDAPTLFGQYAAFAAKHLGQLVDFWVTINEPAIYAIKGFYEGSWPPGEKSSLAMMRVLRNLARAHILVYRLIHQTSQKTRVGLAHNIFSYQLYRPHNFWDRNFMGWLDRFWNHGFLKKTKGSLDFIGLNYYFHYRLKKFTFRLKQFFVDPWQEQREVSDIGWEVFPPGIAEALVELKQYNVPIYVTENGIASTNDDRRVRYLISYLKELYGAIKAGSDVRGYFYWSLLDNFEWEKGFGPRFGLVGVDFKTQERTLRPSGVLYGKICRQNSLSHDMLKYLGHGQKVKV